MSLRPVGGALRPTKAAACRCGRLSLRLRRSSVRVGDAGIAEADPLAAAEAAGVCVAACPGYQRGRVFAARESGRAGRLDDVLVGYCYAVG